MSSMYAGVSLSKYRWVYGSVTCLALVVFLSVGNIPGDTLKLNAIQNSGHTVAFAFLTLFLLNIIPGQPPLLRKYAFIFFLSLFLGVLVELIQVMYGRGFSAFDVLLDGLGSLSALNFHFGITLRKRGILTKGCYHLALAFLLFLFGFTNVLYLNLADYFSPDLPVISTHESFGASSYIREYNSEVTLGMHRGVWKENLTTSIRVHFEPGGRSALEYLEPGKNWSAYDALAFSVYNPLDTKVMLRVRINAGNQGSSWSVVSAIKSGESEVKMFFDEFASYRNTVFSVENNAMQNIQRIVFSLADSKESVILYFDDLYLTL